MGTIPERCRVAVEQLTVLQTPVFLPGFRVALASYEIRNAGHTHIHDGR